MAIRRLLFIVASWIAISMVQPNARAATTAPATVIGQTEGPARGIAGDDSDRARYAERERKAKELEKFRGGEGVSIYIGGSAVAVALVVIIVLLIL